MLSSSLQSGLSGWKPREGAGWREGVKDSPGRILNHCIVTVFLVSVFNSGCIDESVRLQGPVSTEGRVEVCLDNRWGSVCETGWDDTDAAVVCTELALPSTGKPNPGCMRYCCSGVHRASTGKPNPGCMG